jgi:replicative DNA helicase
MARGSDRTSLTHLLSRIDAVADGGPAHDTVPSGYPSVDKLLGGGFRRGDLVVLGGDVGSGKSSLALAIAHRVAEQGRRTAFYSAEMGVERVLERLLAIEGRVRVDDLRAGTMDEGRRAEVGAAAVRLRDLPLHVERLPAAGVPALMELLGTHAAGASPEAEAERGAEMVGHELVVVDGLQALSGGARDTAEEAAAAVRALKALALDLDVALLLTAPLPSMDARPDMRPTLDDFGAMGAVKQQADVVLALFREGMYEAARALEGATELLVRKNRNGGTGYVDLYFYAQWLRFEDMLEPDR